MELNKVAIQKLNKALNIDRKRRPLFCDLLGHRTLYRGSKDKEKKICVLYFCNTTKEGGSEKAIACYYGVNADGKLDESEEEYIDYNDLIIGIKFKVKCRKKVCRKKKCK